MSLSAWDWLQAIEFYKVNCNCISIERMYSNSYDASIGKREEEVEKGCLRWTHCSEIVDGDDVSPFQCLYPRRVCYITMTDREASLLDWSRIPFERGLLKRVPS